MGLSDLHIQHARKYFSERKSNAWDRGRFVNHCRSSTALSETQIGNAYRVVLHEIKMGGESQQAARACQLLLEEKRRLERLKYKQRKGQDTYPIVQVGNFVAGSIQGGKVIATGHTAIPKQKSLETSPEPAFTELDGISSDSDLPPTEILSSFSSSTHSGDESFHPKTSPKLISTPPASLYPVHSGVKAPEANAIQINATQIKAMQTNGTQTDAPEVSEGEGRQNRLRVEILELDVEFLKRRNAKLEERIDDLMNTIAVMQNRVNSHDAHGDSGAGISC
ncbi:hypothetical protein EV426DRAFT_581932 [Tirmania nivea]|nr:hypothetical protein EV426DRAFT_581932 [Tirmania nivea]